mmetsp:Transcript_18497/g.16374  ORF Transcript_18497/g.16374 Transcript_18497/m.16374 type:complete len:93 (-) Transcript_18497:23-301(-)
MANSIANKSSFSVSNGRFAASTEDLKTRFISNYLYTIYEEGTSQIFATSTVNNIPVLLRVTPEGTNLNIVAVSPVAPLYSLIEEAIKEILSN